MSEENHQHTIDDHGERITAVEAGMTALTSNVERLASTIERNAEASRAEHLETQREIRSIGQRLGDIGKANVPLYLTGVVVTMAIVGAILFWPLQAINQLKDEQNVARQERKQSAIERAVAANETKWVDKYNANENTWIRATYDIKLQATTDQRKQADEFIRQLHENDFKWEERLQDLTHDTFKDRMDRMERRLQEQKP